MQSFPIFCSPNCNHNNWHHQESQWLHLDGAEPGLQLAGGDYQSQDHRQCQRWQVPPAFILIKTNKLIKTKKSKPAQKYKGGIISRRTTVNVNVDRFFLLLSWYKQTSHIKPTKSWQAQKYKIWKIYHQHEGGLGIGSLPHHSALNPNPPAEVRPQSLKANVIGRRSLSTWASRRNLMTFRRSAKRCINLSCLWWLEIILVQMKNDHNLVRKKFRGNIANKIYVQS